MTTADEALERQFWPEARPSKSRAPKLVEPGFRTGDDVRAESIPGGSKPMLLRAELRAHLRQAPQVLVKITGGSRGVAGITAHLHYISDKGAREVEDQNGYRHRGLEEIDDLRLQWRDSGSQLPWTGDRKEAQHILLQMPAGTDPERLLDAARGFAKAEFDGHLYAMALHTHQSTPHVHLIVRSEGVSGRRLDPRKADLHRWRLRFAYELRERGIDAAASRQRTRGYAQRHEQLWEKRLESRQASLLRQANRASALGDGIRANQLRERAESLRSTEPTRARPTGRVTEEQVAQARAGWQAVRQRLALSTVPGDADLAREIGRFIEHEFDRATPERTVGRGR